MKFIDKYKLYKIIVNLKPTMVKRFTHTYLSCAVGMYDLSCFYDKQNGEYKIYVEYPTDIVIFDGFFGKKLFNYTKKYLENGQVR